jgi:uncharacterized protein (TIGR02145 family)
MIMLAAAMSFAACQEVEAPLTEENVLSAVIEQDETTKTEMDDNNNILWSANDQIIAFMKSSYGHKYQVKSSFIGKSYADFSRISSAGGDDLSAGNEWDHNVAYYPYSSSVECLKSGSNYTLDVVLPSEQTYASESFGNGSMAMVAVSEDNNIVFKNVLGGMKLQLRGTQKVKSIKLEGKNNEKLSGAATVTAYTDETKPAITMASGASKTITLNCGSGVQLNESKATEFIISLPPVLFSKGFTVTVTDAEGKTYTVETDKANTVLRSSILTMPPFKLGKNPSDEESGDDDELIVPVSSVNLNYTSIKLSEGYVAQLTATVNPKDATDKNVVWSSDNPSVASVDQTGIVTALHSGTAKISAAAGGKVSTCMVTVLVAVDYIDEYGVNHGKGTAIGMAIWAPVNCGYHETDFKYGKLYQWGRRYGQGYSGEFYDGDWDQTYSDAIVSSIEEGGISAITGQHKSKSNVFFTSTSEEYNSDWLYPQDGKLWNSGSESNPVKTEYDPCPDGWRVPTYAELVELSDNYSSWTTDENGQSGIWFSGANSCTETVPRVFFPFAGFRYYYNGDSENRGYTYYGYYWSSRPSTTEAYYLHIYFCEVRTHYRAYGYSVRCVQE